MRQAIPSIRRFLRDQDGKAAAEYAVMAVLIIAVCVLVVESIGSTVAAQYHQSTSTIIQAGAR